MCCQFPKLEFCLLSGLKTSEDARFYALSRKFDAFSNAGKTLVVQFSVKHEQDIDCGGGYVKVFDRKLEQKDMHGESPYEIMFGPDICGPGTKKVHVIFSYKGKNLLINKDIRCKDDVYTHLYTLIVKPDNTYEVLIDNEKVESGSLEGDWDFLAPKLIKVKLFLSTNCSTNIVLYIHFAPTIFQYFTLIIGWCLPYKVCLKQFE